MRLFYKVWLKRAIKDEYYGEAYLDAEPDNRHIVLECNLIGGPMTKGKLEVELQSMTNLTAI